MPVEFNSSIPTSPQVNHPELQAEASDVAAPGSYGIRLNAWSNSGTPGERRLQAVDIINNYLRTDSTDSWLNLNDLDLTELPPIPDSVITLSAHHNRLSVLPRLGGNIENLWLQYNNFLDLPEMPATLCVLSISNNPIARDMGRVSLRTRTLAEETIMGIRDRQIHMYGGLVQAEALQGPRQAPPLWRYGTSQDPESRIETASAGVVTWYPKEQRAEILSKWEKFDALDGAKEFGLFMEKLGATKFVKAAEGTAAVHNWLARMGESEEIAQVAFDVALRGTNSCVDSVSLMFNQMQQKEIELEVKKGIYDEQLPDLVDHARRGFRQEYLDDIATDKMAAARSNDHWPDEIEVYLGLQVHLNISLELNSVVKDMHFYGCSDLSVADIKNAETVIKRKENADFVAWFATWEPWTAVAKRLDPFNYDAMQERILEVYSSDEFKQQCDNNEKKHAETPMNDGQRMQVNAKFSKDLGASLSKEIKVDFMRKFFASRGSETLLAPKWPLETQVQ